MLSPARSMSMTSAMDRGAAAARSSQRFLNGATMSRNAIRPARKAATATSLAALRTIGAAPPASSASRASRSAGKRSRSGASNRASRSGQIEPLGRRLHPLRPGQRMGDRNAHVGAAELGKHRSVDIFDHRMDDRLRMDEDVDPLARQPEQMMRLDQLEPLVHHRRRIDADLGAHRPVGMRHRLLGRRRRHLFAARSRGTGRRWRSGSILRHRMSGCPARH